MILQRLANAIRHQNWSQIITEILIVVIGIFLGLQVQTWNENRVAEDQESRIVEYFISDLNKNTEILEERLLFMEFQIAKGYRTLELLEGDQLEPADKADFEEGLIFLGRTNPLTAYLNSFNEDTFSKIINIKLRLKLDGYFGSLRRSAGVGENIRLTMTNGMIYVRQNSTIIEGTGDQRLSVYDFGLLKDDQKYKSSFATGLNGLLAYRTATREVIKNSNLMLDILNRFQADEEITEISFQ